MQVDMQPRLGPAQCLQPRRPLDLRRLRGPRLDVVAQRGESRRMVHVPRILRPQPVMQRVPVDILDKPDALTRDEFEIMKLHVPNGIKILENAEGISPTALEVVGRHHERYSGNGYAFGLQGDTIGEFGLISAIVDTYDAITSDRSYHLSLSAADALKIIYEGRERAYHPWLTEQFIQCMGIFPIGSIVELSTGSIGVVITANRQRRLRPRVALVLSPEKKPLAPVNIIDLMAVTHDASGKPVEIKTMLPSGTFGINPTDYIPLRH